MPALIPLAAGLAVAGAASAIPAIAAVSIAGVSAASIIGGLTSVGVSALMAPRAKKAQLDRTGSTGGGAMVETSSNVDPILIPYGRRLLSGSRVLTATSVDNTTLFVAIVIGEGEVWSINQTYLDSVAITDARFTSAVPVVEYFVGTDTQAASSLLVNNVPGGKWTAAHQLKGCAYAAIKLVWNATAFPTGAPKFTFDVTGRKVADVRGGGPQLATCDNPANVLYDYLTNTRYGAMLPASAVGDFTEAANYCDQTVNNPANPQLPGGSNAVNLVANVPGVGTGYSGGFTCVHSGALYMGPPCLNTGVSLGTPFKSTDNGDTWTACAALPGGVANNTHPRLSSANGLLWAYYSSGSTAKLASSSDGGASWTLKNGNVESDSAADRAMYYAAGKLVLYPTREGYYPLTSTDGGTTWSAAAQRAGYFGNASQFYYAFTPVWWQGYWWGLYPMVRVVGGGTSQTTDVARSTDLLTWTNIGSMTLPGFTSITGTATVAPDGSKVYYYWNNGGSNRALYSTTASDCTGTWTVERDSSALAFGAGAMFTNGVYLGQQGLQFLNGWMFVGNFVSIGLSGLGPSARYYDTSSGEKRYRAVGVVNPDDTIIDNIRAIAGSMRAQVPFSSGRFQCRCKMVRAWAGFTFDESNIIGAWSVTRGNKRTFTNRYKARWLNPAREYQPDIAWYDDSGIRTVYDNGRVLEGEVALPLTISGNTAARIAKLEMLESRYALTVTFVASSAALTVEVGDIVKVTHSTPGWSGKLFRVDVLELHADGNIGVTLHEYDDAMMNESGTAWPA
jgi:hypothetical protein